MKKDKRQFWLALTCVRFPFGTHPALCSFCRYAEWIGCCEDSECDCQHSLWRVSDYQFESAIEGGDCWGFRPDVSEDVAIGMVNNWLHGKDVVLTDDLRLSSCQSNYKAAVSFGP